jgi:uncharacterized protein YdcH (DUF465 family)
VKTLNALNPPGQILPTNKPEPDSAWSLNKGETLFMERHTQEEELKAHLLATNEQFRTLAEQHAHLKRKVEEIESKPHVTPEDELEEQQIKKQKLRVKDLMNGILAQYKHASVG